MQRNAEARDRSKTQQTNSCDVSENPVWLSVDLPIAYRIALAAMTSNFSSKRSTRFIALACFFVVATVSAADKTPGRPDASALKKLNPGVFDLRGVTLDNSRQSVSFPAAVNMTSNLVEYVVVCDDGKTHESLLKTSVEPRDIHVAMLLIGAEGAPPQQAANPDKDKVLQGDKARVWIHWRSKDGENERVRAEELIRNEQTKRPMKPGDWVYNGSWIFNGRFVAQTERSIISIIFDRDALMNSAHPQRGDDEIWFANPKRIPKLDHPVRVEIELLKNDEQKTSDQE